MFRRLPKRARKVLTVLGVLMVILGGIAAFTGCQPGIRRRKGRGSGVYGQRGDGYSGGAEGADR